MSLFPIRIAHVCASIALLALFLTQLVSGQAVKNIDTDDVLLPGDLTKIDVANGWIALFDGQTLFGWRAVDPSTNWEVVDGVIQADSGKTSLLRTTTEFDDYELKVDFFAESGTNSGVFLRTSPNPKNAEVDCYELNIAGKSNPFPTGALVGRKNVSADFVSERWHTYHVTVDGNHVRVKLNGETVNEYVDRRGLRRGYIGLQFNSGLIKFRNILLRPLALGSIFNGKDLSQWDDSQSNGSRFSVTDARELKVIGGRGQLESKAQFADFVFSMQCKTNARGLNSGVFFRSIPGEFTNGYESQIQNQFLDNDRTKPVDCGTGGIFHRSDARRINADDEEWFSKTIVTTGPHIAVWVNGLQVTDWTDRRKSHTNPRKGLRKEKGTFILQGHDPTTDILFRNIKSRELSHRR